MVSSVYKYLGPERISFLSDGLIRFSQPADLNDPYECLAAFPDISPSDMLSDLVCGVIEKVSYSEAAEKHERIQKAAAIGSALVKIEGLYKKNKNFIRDFTNDFNSKRINNGLGILSLSRRWDSALMWSHYTSAYKGFCVGFDRGHDFFKEILDGGELKRTSLMPVKYSKTRPVVPRRKELANGLEIFTTKSIDWSYEQEDRLLALVSMASKVVACEPYPIHLFKIPLHAVTELIVGRSASEELRLAALDVGKTLGIPVYRTQVSSSSFDVERVLLDDEVFL